MTVRVSIRETRLGRDSVVFQRFTALVWLWVGCLFWHIERLRLEAFSA